MVSIRRILRVAKEIEAAQREGSDYDELYFGLQDVIEMLEQHIKRSMFEQQLPASVRRARKRKRSKKQKLLDDMASKAWKKYQKQTPNGKKTYIDIRTRVSKSADYKRKAKKL